METEQILEIIGYLIYAALGLMAVWGVFCVILLARRIKRKRFPSDEAEEHFLSELGDHVQASDKRRAVNLCQSPTYAGCALPQLTLMALEQPTRGSNKLRALLVSKFETGLLADLEYRLSWVQTVVRSAPMLGLLGTVVGMIGAFGKIAGHDRVDPTALAENISLALATTAIGLTIAIPLVLCAVMMNARIRRLQDSVETGIERVLDDLDKAVGDRLAKARGAAPEE